MSIARENFSRIFFRQEVVEEPLDWTSGSAIKDATLRTWNVGR